MNISQVDDGTPVRASEKKQYTYQMEIAKKFELMLRCQKSMEFISLEFFVVFVVICQPCRRRIFIWMKRVLFIFFSVRKLATRCTSDGCRVLCCLCIPWSRSSRHFNFLRKVWACVYHAKTINYTTEKKLFRKRMRKQNMPANSSKWITLECETESRILFIDIRQKKKFKFIHVEVCGRLIFSDFWISDLELPTFAVRNSFTFTPSSMAGVCSSSIYDGEAESRAKWRLNFAVK